MSGPPPTSYLPSKVAGRAVVILCAALAAACLNLNGPEQQVIIWEALLAPSLAHPDLMGQAALAAQLNGTDAGIGIRGATPGAVHTWRVRIGTCAAPGDGIGPQSDYPELVVTQLGEASADMRIGHRLSTDTTYYAEVRASSTDTARVACGDFQQR